VNFNELPLDQNILKVLAEIGYEKPTKIQKEAIPQIDADHDLLASANTGTGKTAAFLLPILGFLMKNRAQKLGTPKALVLVPTRELALQVAEEAKKFSKYLNGLHTVCIVGGVPYPIQKKQLSKPCDLLIATPGRLIDQIESGRINLSAVEVLILDEADRMLDMGFLPPVEQIASLTPKERQTLLFSATLKGEVLKLSKKLLKDPVTISAEEQVSLKDNIEQRLHIADNIEHKHLLLDSILEDPTLELAIVFTATKRLAGQLQKRLYDSGHKVGVLHGDLNQGQRTRTIDAMKKGRLKILVATDVAARGIDVQAISHVINFDLPNSAEDYVHRIGRTGRAGSKGVALSFATTNEASLVYGIERFIGGPLAQHVIPGLEPAVKLFKKKEGAGVPSRSRAPRAGAGRFSRGKPSFKRSRY
jgi:superfamily II DNA/RNA helicase